MGFLVVNVTRNRFHFISTQAQYAISFLPPQLDVGIDLFVYAERSCAFHLPDEFADQYGGRQSDEQMCVVRHGIVTDWRSAARFRFLIEDFQQLRTPRAINQRLPRMRRPDEMIVKL